MKTIPLSNHGKNKGQYEALVDDTDYDWLMQWKWCVHRNRNGFYAERNEKLPNGKYVYVGMHREILGLCRGDKRQGDHINHKTLDNRRENLRIVTNQENTFNRSGTKGYGWHKRSRKYQAYIQVNGQQKSLGYFSCEEDAVAARAAAKQKYHKIAS